MSEYAELHDELRRVARSALGDAIPSGADLWSVATELGWLSLEVPEACGGAGVTFAETAVVLDQLGRAAASGPFVGSSVLGVAAARSVLTHAEAASDVSDDAEAMLSHVAAGQTRVAVALAPSGDAATVSAPFELHGGRITGQARGVVDAPDADRVLLLTRVGQDLALVVLGADRVSVRAQPVLDATRSIGDVSVSGVEVAPRELWRITDEDAAALFDRAAVTTAIDALGVAAAMLDLTVDYVGERRQFDRPIGSFQAVKHQCADVLVELSIGRELVDAAVEAVSDASAGSDHQPADDQRTGDHRAERRRVERTLAASRAKAYCTELGVRATGVAMQLHGGIGYTWESPVHVYMKRALLNRALFGSPDAHRRSMGARYVS